MNFKLNKNDLTAIALFLFFSLAVLSSQRHFIDDMGRSVDGYFGLSDNGRPFADLILMLASLGPSLADSGPWFQFIAIPVFISIPFVINKSLDDKASALLFIVAIVNPFIIENIMYRYDSLSMSYSLFSSIASCILISKGLRFVIPSIILLLTSISSYQPAMSAFIVLSFFFFVIGRERELRLLFTRGLVFLLSYVIYSKIISPLFIKGYYTNTYSQLIDLYDVNSFVNNFESMARFCIDNAGNTISLLYLVSFLISIISVSYLSLTRKISALKSLTSLISIVAIAITPIIILSVLKYPTFAPRVYISLGVSMACLVGTPVLLLQNTRKICISIAIITASISINMAFIVSSSNNAQMRYDDALSSQILNTIQMAIDEDKNIDSIGFIGYMQPSEISKLSFKKHHIAETLTPLYIKGNWWWGNYMLQMRGIKLKRYNVDYKKFDCLNSRKAYFYNYTISNGALVLDFSKKICK